HANLDLFEPVEHVELRDAESGQAVRERDSLQEQRIEPAAAARPSGRRADLGADRREMTARLVAELRRERAGTDTGRVRLHDTEDVVDAARPDAGPGQRAAGRRVRRRDERIRAEIDVRSEEHTSELQSRENLV